MNDMEQKVRALLGDLADDVSPHRTVPASLQERVRRRVALNSTLIGGLVIALGVGAFATVRSIGSSKNPTIPQASSSSSTPAATTPQPCTAGQLRAVGALSGAAGSREGFIELRNYSDKTCTLKGQAIIELLDGNLKPISTGVEFNTTIPQWQANGSPTPAGWPVVTLQSTSTPRSSAYIRLRWTNWCPQGRAAPLWRVEIPGSGTVDVINGMDQMSPPPCNGPGQPSKIDVGPFEPRPTP